MFYCIFEKTLRLKFDKYILLLLFVSLINCSKPKQDLGDGSTNSKIDNFLKSSENQSLNNAKKQEYNLRALHLLQTQTHVDVENLFKIVNNAFVLKAWPLYKKAALFSLQKSLEEKKISNIAKSYRYCGRYYLNVKNNDSALYYYLKSEKLYSKLNDKPNLAYVLIREGMVQFFANDFLGADLSITKAYNLTKGSDDRDQLFLALSMFGIVSSQMKDYKKAIEKQKEALALIYKYQLFLAGNEETTLNNIGNGYQELMENKTAIHYFNLALKNKKLNTQFPEIYATIIDNLAYSKFKSNEFKELPDLFLK